MRLSYTCNTYSNTSEIAKEERNESDRRQGQAKLEAFDILL